MPKRISRRTFLVSLGLFLIGSSFAFSGVFRRLFKVDKTLDKDAPLVIKSLLNHMLPASGNNPGAVALGADRLVFQNLNKTERRQSFLYGLVKALEKERYLKLSGKEQKKLITHYLELQKKSRPPQLARYIRRILDFGLREYYTQSSAWSDIGYRVPGFGGYPNYANCK